MTQGGTVQLINTAGISNTAGEGTLNRTKITQQETTVAGFQQHGRRDNQGQYGDGQCKRSPQQRTIIGYSG